MKSLASSSSHLCELIERLARINAADEWVDGLNPTQLSALSYLSRANQYSQAPSHVAEYLGTTRGTVSQTLKALARKKMIKEIRSTTDRRSISYLPTKQGIEAIKRITVIEDALGSLPKTSRQALAQRLEEVIRATLDRQGRKQFGMCINCHHHKRSGANGYCELLQVDLEPGESRLICHEYRE